MLHGRLTKTGIAVELTGCPSDFAGFYDTLWKLVYLPEDDPKARQIDDYHMGVIAEFRHAFEDRRNTGSGNPRIRLLLISFLALIRSLRVYARKARVDLAMQSDLYRLQYIADDIFVECPSRIQDALKAWHAISRDFDAAIKASPEFLSSLDHQLLISGNDQKARLRKLPNILQELVLGSKSESFKRYRAEVSHQSKKTGRPAAEFALVYDFPPEEEW